MARLNTLDNESDRSSRRGTAKAEQLNVQNSPETVAYSPRLRRPNDPSHRNSRRTSAFDIFSDADLSMATAIPQEIHTSRPGPSRKQKKTRTLKATHINSLLPLQQGARQRPSIKVETDDYEKENDVTDEVTDPYAVTMDVASQRPRNTRSMALTAGRSRADDRALSDLNQETESEEGFLDNSFNSLDDFIVSDNDDLSFHETSDSDTEEESQKVSAPSTPPKPARKRLLRGRRPSPDIERKPLKKSPSKTPFSLEPIIPNTIRLRSGSKSIPKQQFQDDFQLSTKLSKLNIDDESGPASQLKTDLALSIIDLDPSPPHHTLSDSRPHTPEVILSSERSLRSPTKSKARIPPTPHRESTDAFWSQEVTNNWVDLHSPRKEKHMGQTLIEQLRDFDISDSEDSRGSPSSTTLSTPKSKYMASVKTPSKTALKRAEAEQRRAAKARRLSFNNKKQDFARTFFEELDNAVSAGEIQRLANSTGGVAIIWSKTLQKTAGRAHWSGDRFLVGESGALPKIETKHAAKIELAERVIDDEYRLINTLAHEYCHLAAYMISKVTNNPHGPVFKMWANRCAEAMKDHPLYGGKINITTRHSYKIDYKYVWSCVGCSITYGRHSKSIDPSRVSCGRCRGKLEQIKPKPRTASPKKTTFIPIFQNPQPIQGDTRIPSSQSSQVEFGV